MLLSKLLPSSCKAASALMGVACSGKLDRVSSVRQNMTAKQYQKRLLVTRKSAESRRKSDRETETEFFEEVPSRADIHLNESNDPEGGPFLLPGLLLVVWFSLVKTSFLELRVRSVCVKTPFQLPDFDQVLLLAGASLFQSFPCRLLPLRISLEKRAFC